MLPFTIAFVIWAVLPGFNKIEPVRTALNPLTTVVAVVDENFTPPLTGDVIFNSPDTSSSTFEFKIPCERYEISLSGLSFVPGMDWLSNCNLITLVLVGVIFIV